MFATLLLTTALLAPAPDGMAPRVIPASGCHSDVRTHVVPEYRMIIPHLHRRSDCAPVIAEGGGRVERYERRRSRDCHADVRRHWVDGVLLWHRHIGPDCRVRRATKGRVVVP
jgi:hypothetical protein